MSESSAADSTSTAKTPKKPASGLSRASEPPQAPRWVAFAALAIALIATVLGVIGWFRPSTGAGTFSDQETQDAKGRICQVTGTVRQATSLNTNLTNPIPGDPIGGLAVAANARLALFGGGAFLNERLAAEPATPADLSKAVGALATTMQQLSINYLAGAAPDSPVQQPLRDGLTGQLSELDQLCQ